MISNFFNLFFSKKLILAYIFLMNILMFFSIDIWKSKLILTNIFFDWYLEKGNVGILFLDNMECRVFFSEMKSFLDQR